MNRGIPRAPSRSGLPFRRAKQVSRIVGRVSYLHPTKGWRFRRPTPQLVFGLAAATA